MRNLIIYCLVMLVFSVNSYSQNRDRELSNIIASANKAFDNHNYYGAAKLYERALEYNDRMYDVVWKTAESYRLDNDYVNAAKFYKMLVDSDLQNHPKASYYLGQMLKADEEYIKAQYFFNRYYEDNKDGTDNIFVDRAKRELEYCWYAWRLMSNPSGVTINAFDTVINTVYSEFAPVILDDSLIFFSSIRPKNDSAKTHRSKIYVTKIQDSIFSKAMPLDTIINMHGYDVANPYITKDGKVLLFSAMKADFQSESHLYKSFWDNKTNNWAKPELMPEIINVKGYNSIQPYLAERENNTDVLLWSSNRPDGEGGYDIWYCEILPQWTYGVVRNLGRPILDNVKFREFYDTTSTVNTVGNEITPFYDVSDSLLYFSSDWLKGMGGYDIFSRKGNFVVWDSVLHLGYPVNTAQNDFYFKIFHDSRYVVFTSNRKGSLALSHQSCCNDLYFYRLDEIIDEEKIRQDRIELITERTKLLVPIELYFHNDRPTPRSWDTITDVTYTNSYYDYIALLEEYRGEFARGLRRTNRELAIDSVNNFFANYVEFNYNKLLEFTESIKQLLEEGQRIEITIKGYTSPLNTAEYNINLAKRRISSLVNYFNDYDDGYFLEYIESGQISFEFVAFGKALADAGVSSDPNDPRNSVYSPAASRERRIEIIAVSIENEINNVHD
jgi:hypothetical protein